VVGVHRLHVALLRVSAAHQTGRRRPVAVDHVQIGKRRDPAVQRNAVLTVEEIRQRRHGNLSIVGLVAARRVDDVHLVAAVFEPIPPRADRVRYPVDTGEVTVGEESDVHARACRRRVVCFAPPEHSPGSGCCADPPRTVSATATVPATAVAPPSRSDRPAAPLSCPGCATVVKSRVPLGRASTFSFRAALIPSLCRRARPHS